MIYSFFLCFYFFSVYCALYRRFVWMPLYKSTTFAFYLYRNNGYFYVAFASC